MKKVLLCLLLLFTLSACKQGNSSSDDDKYLDYCSLLAEHSGFAAKSEFFDVSTDITAIEGGYRFYIIIDNPKVAMYNVEAIAIEDGVDYSKTMAANIGIFEDNRYTMIPNQANPEQGFVKGISISGISGRSEPHLKLMVQWDSKDLSVTNREFISVLIDNGENNE